MARTTALNKIEATLYEPTFYKVIQGGQGAGKTYAIMTLLVGYCDSYAGSRVTVVGMTYDHLKDGAISDFKNILNEANRWSDERYNKSEHTYYFPNGSELQFRSVDKMKGRGPRRDVVYVNEADSISWETFEHVSGRSKDFAIIDYNPVSKFWAHEKLVEKPPKTGVSFLILTYKDNEALPAQERENILSHKPAAGEDPSNWWTVYGLGQIGSLEGNVYSGWQESTLAKITEVKKVNKGSSIVEYESKLVRYGLDFGFSNDESALVAIYELSGQDPDKATPDAHDSIRTRSGHLGVVEMVYKKGLLGSQYASLFEKIGVDPSVLIVADAARPEIIAEIRKAGYRIIGADKSPGSVLSGIDSVSQHQISFCGANLKREYLSYAWRKKRSGEILDEPEDGNDHLMDAMRYAIYDLGKTRFDF